MRVELHNYNILVEDLREGAERPPFWDDLAPSGRRAMAFATPRRRPKRVHKKIALRDGRLRYPRRCSHNNIIPGVWPEDEMCADCSQLFINFGLLDGERMPDDLKGKP